MNDKKNIDRFFQEKFKDFEAQPNEIVWKNIEANLKNKKNKRRLVPFWLQLSGIAAALIMGIFSINHYFGNDSVENKVVLEEKSLEAKSKIEHTNSKKSIENQNGNKINSEINNEVVISHQKDNAKNGIIVKEGNSSKNKIVITEKTEKIYNSRGANRKIQIANKSNLRKKKSEKDFYAFNKNQKSKNNLGLIKDKENKENLKKNQFNDSKINVENDLPNQIISPNNLVENKDKRIEKITDEKLGNKKLDAVAKVETVPNALEELLKKKEEEKKKIAKTKLDRWQITSNVAPIYFSSTSSNSPIDSEFDQNKKTYNNNLSLGLGVNYAVSKKIKIRSGVNKLTLGYSTKDVIFQAGLSARTIKNVSNSGNGAPIIITNRENSVENLTASEKNIQSFNEGQINQKMGYYEVPLEMSYALIDKKFGVNLIGGLSTLFLSENSVSVSSGSMSADIGKANNLSDVHFSTNFGVGFKYKFFKAFEAKLEPTFKYQINTFSNNVGGFNPYFIGLYSGVSFSF